MKGIQKSRGTKFCAFVIGMSILSTAAEAIPLGPGAALALSGTTVAAHPNLAGIVLVDTLRPFSITVSGTTYTGHVQDRVVKESATGTLDFYYRIVLDKQYLQAERMIVHRRSFAMTTTGAGISTDVDYRTDGLGLEGPSSASRTADGSWVSFLYNGLFIGPGSANSTRFTFISTNAKKFNAGGFLIFKIDASANVALPVYQPVQ